VVNVTGSSIRVRIKIRSGEQRTSFKSLVLKTNLRTGKRDMSANPWTQFSTRRQQKLVNFIVLRSFQIKVSDGWTEYIHNVTCKLTFIVCLLLALQTLVLNTIMKYDCYLAVSEKRILSRIKETIQVTHSLHYSEMF
jgi:hypothetical protein